MALLEEIQRKALRDRMTGLVATEVFMSSTTRDHLAEELRRHSSLWSMRGKPSAGNVTLRVPTEISVTTREGTLNLKIRIKEGIPSGSYILDYKKLVEVIDPKTGRKEHVAEPSR